MIPSNQLLLPSLIQKATVKTFEKIRQISPASILRDMDEDIPAKKRTMHSKGSNSRVSGFPIIHPRITSNLHTRHKQSTIMNDLPCQGHSRDNKKRDLDR
jgi:hypothetical protein